MGEGRRGPLAFVEPSLELRDLLPDGVQALPDGARWLITSSDASFDRFVRAYGEPAAEARLPDPGDPDVERLTRLAAEHGIEILGPPGTLPS